MRDQHLIEKIDKYKQQAKFFYRPKSVYNALHEKIKLGLNSNENSQVNQKLRSAHDLSASNS